MILFRRFLIASLVIWLSLFELTAIAYAGSDRGMLKPVTQLAVKASSGDSNSDSEQTTLYQQSRPANLVLDPPGPFVLGDHPTLLVHLITEFGKPIPNQPIIIYVDGKRKESGPTDSDGLAAITLKFKFSAGKYHIKAVYAGVPALGLPASSAEADMIIQPFNAMIRIIPPTAGIKVKFNDQIHTSDEKGFVNFQIGQTGSYSLEILPVDAGLLPAHTKMKFSRWNDNIFTPRRQVFFPRRHPLEAGFVLEYLVDEIFLDSTGALVNASRVSSMTLKGLGSSYTFDRAGPIWLPANRLSRRIGEQLESQNIVYYFNDIQIDGANVITKSQQRFRIRPAAVWRINVLVYSIQFSARDAMFHFPIGSGIALTYPDGHIEKFLFDLPGSEIKIFSLPRGSYSATVITRGGSAPPTPIHLSRDQNVELLVLSFPDMGVMFGLPLIFALTLFFIGRPRLFQVVRRPSEWKELIRQKTSRDSLPSQVFKAVLGLLFSTPPSQDR